MRSLAEVRLLSIGVASAVWVAFAVALPRLMLLGLMAYFRLQVLLSPTKNRGVAFGGAHWTSRQAMIATAAIPPVLVVSIWLLCRLLAYGSHA